jgi:hypothetical protein
MNGIAAAATDDDTMRLPRALIQPTAAATSRADSLEWRSAA